MADDSDLDSTTLAQRLVLLGVARRTLCQDESPHSAAVRKTCARLLDDVSGDVVGNLSEADVTRRLNELAGERLVKQVDVENQSPVGKGRPRYDLNVAPDALLDGLETDERVAPAVERVRADWE